MPSTDQKQLAVGITSFLAGMTCACVPSVFLIWHAVCMCWGFFHKFARFLPRNMGGWAVLLSACVLALVFSPGYHGPHAASLSHIQKALLNLFSAATTVVSRFCLMCKDKPFLLSVVVLFAEICYSMTIRPSSTQRQPWGLTLDDDYGPLGSHAVLAGMCMFAAVSFSLACMAEAARRLSRLIIEQGLACMLTKPVSQGTSGDGEHEDDKTKVAAASTPTDRDDVTRLRAELARVTKELDDSVGRIESLVKYSEVECDICAEYIVKSNGGRFPIRLITPSKETPHACKYFLCNVCGNKLDDGAKCHLCRTVLSRDLETKLFYARDEGLSYLIDARLNVVVCKRDRCHEVYPIGAGATHDRQCVGLMGFCPNRISFASRDNDGNAQPAKEVGCTFYGNAMQVDRHLEGTGGLDRGCKFKGLDKAWKKMQNRGEGTLSGLEEAARAIVEKNSRDPEKHAGTSWIWRFLGWT